MLSKPAGIVGGKVFWTRARMNGREVPGDERLSSQRICDARIETWKETYPSALIRRGI
jgi:hypothetical protein